MFKKANKTTAWKTSLKNRKKLLKAVLVSLVSTILLVIILDFGKHEFTDPANMALVLLYFVVMSFVFYKTSIDKKIEQTEL